MAIDKPYRWTSFDVVKKVRSYFKLRKVGHAGTLDPLATGLLLVLTGKMTKKASELQAQDKSYITELVFGGHRPSYDLETEIEREYPFEHITPDGLLEACTRLTGEIEQVPPLYSAVKIKGKRAYEYARNGVEKKLEPKKISIYNIEILSFDLPKVRLKIDCSKGTYIRAIARELGLMLHSAAYLKQLSRERIGSYSLEHAYKIHELDKIPRE